MRTCKTTYKQIGAFVCVGERTMRWLAQDREMGGYGLHHNGHTATPIVASFFKMLFDCLNQIHDLVEVKVGLEDGAEGACFPALSHKRKLNVLSDSHADSLSIS